MTDLPFSPSCEKNREPILAKLREIFADRHVVLEIGSGTGQHAVYLAEHLPHVVWHPSDRKSQHAGIEAWLAHAGLANVRAPLALDVGHDAWPQIDGLDAVFSANTAHIMPLATTLAMVTGVAKILPHAGIFALYGAFNYNGRFTSESNQRFDDWLKSQAPHQGVRDFEQINQEAQRSGLQLVNDFEMPSNNRLLVWRRA